MISHSMSENKVFPSIENSVFGETEHMEVLLFKLRNRDLEIGISNYGCTVVNIFAPDSSGNKKNIVTGFNNLEAYTKPHPHFGCIVGRFANRISNSNFLLDGKQIFLSMNEPPNHLHGGNNGFHRKVWKVEKIIRETTQAGIVFSYLSKDGEEGYPGNLTATVTYLLTEDNRLVIHCAAVTDQPTIVNMTNHSYFNLSGFEMPDIYNHQLQIFSDYYTTKNEINTSSGKIEPVKNTPMDFSKPKFIGEEIHLMTTDNGYEYNYVLSFPSEEMTLAAILREPVSGRKLEVFTNAPGIQLYTSNWLDGSIIGAQGIPYQQHAAVALETQAIPDAPNHPAFPSSVLRPGEVYKTSTIFHFSTE